jgi:hypothetical protein
MSAPTNPSLSLAYCLAPNSWPTSHRAPKQEEPDPGPLAKAPDLEPCALLRGRSGQGCRREGSPIVASVARARATRAVAGRSQSHEGRCCAIRCHAGVTRGGWLEHDRPSHAHHLTCARPMHSHPTCFCPLRLMIRRLRCHSHYRMWYRLGTRLCHWTTHRLLHL